MLCMCAVLQAHSSTCGIESLVCTQVHSCETKYKAAQSKFLLLWGLPPHRKLSTVQQHQQEQACTCTANVVQEGKTSRVISISMKSSALQNYQLTRVSEYYSVNQGSFYVFWHLHNLPFSAYLHCKLLRAGNFSY